MGWDEACQLGDRPQMNPQTYSEALDLEQLGREHDAPPRLVYPWPPPLVSTPPGRPNQSGKKKKKKIVHSLAPVATYFHPASDQMSPSPPPPSWPSALSETSSGRTRGSELHRLAIPKMPKHTHANQTFWVCS